MDRPTILIVDDQPLVLTAIARFMEQKGYTVHTASNGKEGLAGAETVRPDLIITDVMMPVMDGWDFVRALRATPAFTLVPVIILSDQDSAESRMQGFRLGADDYVAKTTIVDELEVRIARALERTATIHRALGLTPPAAAAAAAVVAEPAPAREIAEPFKPAGAAPLEGGTGGGGASMLNLPPLVEPPPKKPGRTAPPKPVDSPGAPADGSAGMSGTLDQIGLASIITLLGTSGKTGILTLTRAGEGESGRLFMRDGNILKIRVDSNPDIENIEAFTVLMRWKNATFSFRVQDVTAHDELGVPMEHLLMEASRIFDEESP